MKKLLLTLVAALTLGVTNIYADSVEDLLAKRSDDCPISITDGMSIVSAVPGQGEMIFTYAIDESKVNFADLKAQRDMLHDVMATDMATTKNADTRKLTAYCKANNANIVLRMQGANDSFDIVITPADLNY